MKNKYRNILIIIGIILTERIGWYLYISFPRTMDIKVFFTVHNTIMLIPFMINMFILTYLIFRIIKIFYIYKKKESNES